MDKPMHSSEQCHLKAWACWAVAQAYVVYGMFFNV